MARTRGDVHRRLALHRVPGVPGGVQAVEPARARGAGVDRLLPEPRALHRQELSARALLRRAGDDKVGDALAHDVRRVQALRPGRLPRSLSRPARSTGPSTARSTSTRTSATAAATACRPARSAWSAFNHDTGTATKCTFCNDRHPQRARARVRQSVPDRVDQVRLPRRAGGQGAEARRRAPEAGRTQDAQLYGEDQNGPLGGLNAFFLLAGKPSIYGLPEQPKLPQRNVVRRLAPLDRRGDRRRDRGGRSRSARAAGRTEARAEMEPGLLKSADWPLLIDIYFFLGGIAGGAFVIATIAHLLDARPVSRASSASATTSRSWPCIPAPILLIVDLGLPTRFLHMMMVSKPSTAIGMGP